jgi:hypothetical protein
MRRLAIFTSDTRGGEPRSGILRCGSISHFNVFRAVDRKSSHDETSARRVDFPLPLRGLSRFGAGTRTRSPLLSRA